MTTSTLILLLCLTLLFSAFFSGMEIAYISASKLEMELAGKKGGRTGRQLQYFKERTQHFIGTTLIGNNIALVIFGILITDLLEGPIKGILPEAFNGDFIVLLGITFVSTLIVLFVGEFFPKNFFRLNPVRKLFFFVMPFSFFYYLFIPFVGIVLFVSRLIIGDEDDKAGFAKVDLQNYLQSMADDPNVEDEIATTMFAKALDLSEVKARECMIPRNEIEAIEFGAPYHEIKEKFIKTRFSKLIVYKDSIDNPIGYFHHLNVLKNSHNKIYNLEIFPETKPARDILQHFIANRKSIGLVVDEFGGTAGLITIEDVIEEIFGEISDEHDDDDFELTQISETEYTCSGRVEMDLMMERYDIEFPDSDYETVAGFIIEHHQSIPKVEETITIGGFEFFIEEATPTKIESVRMFIKPPEIEE